MKGMRTIAGKSVKEMYKPMKSPDVIFPNVSIPLDALPEAKSWKIGKTYEVTLRVKQKGMHMSAGSEGDHGSAQFDIVGVAPHGEVKKPKPQRYSRIAKES